MTSPSVASPPVPVEVTPLTPGNGYEETGGTSFVARRLGRMVTLEGTLANGTPSTTITTLPAGWRPITKIVYGGGWFSMVTVNTDGTIVADGDTLIIGGLSFIAAP